MARLRDSGDFATLDSKIAAGLLNLLRNDELKRRVIKAREEHNLIGLRIQGRQILRIIYDWFRISDCDGVVF